MFPSIGNARGPGISLYGRAFAHASLCCCSVSWCWTVVPCKSARCGHAAAVAVELNLVFSLLIMTRFALFWLLLINGVNLLFNSRTKKLRDELIVDNSLYLFMCLSTKFYHYIQRCDWLVCRKKTKIRYFYSIWSYEDQAKNCGGRIGVFLNVYLNDFRFL